MFEPKLDELRAEISKLKAERDRLLACFEAEDKAEAWKAQYINMQEERDAAFVRGLERAKEIADQFWWRDDFDEVVQAEIDKAKERLCAK